MKVYRVPNIYIYQFNSPLYFANVSVFRSKLFIETGMNPEELGPMTAPGCIEYGCMKVRDYIIIIIAVEVISSLPPSLPPSSCVNAANPPKRDVSKGDLPPFL